jgi:hypothetical protein
MHSVSCYNQIMPFSIGWLDVKCLVIQPDNAIFNELVGCSMSLYNQIMPF